LINKASGYNRKLRCQTCLQTSTALLVDPMSVGKVPSTSVAVIQTMTDKAQSKIW